MKRFAPILIVVFCSCAGPAAVVRWGARCMEETDPDKRLGWISRIVDSGDPKSIKVLIDCLDSAARLEKKPDREHDAKVITPRSAGPEIWGLYVLTGRDFDRDVRKWRDWWLEHCGRLEWDKAGRRFRVKE